MHAEDCGVEIDRRREIHELKDLDLDEKVEIKGEMKGEINEDGKTEVKYRSMYERKAFRGTELVYANLRKDKEILDGIV